MRRALVIGMMLACGACQTVRPDPVVQTIEVQVPVSVPCDAVVDREDIDLSPLLNGVNGILPKTEIVIDALEYVMRQRDQERVALDSCRGLPAS